MKRLALSLLAIAAVASMASPAQAQNWLNLPSFQHWNLNSMVSNEQARINAGRANGSLTPEEANRLQARLNDVNNLKALLARDGISASDRRTIDQQLDQLSQDIYRESNDRQMLGSNPYNWSHSYKPDNTNWRYGHWDNGKWVSKNNWNQYNTWKTRNWNNNWNDKNWGSHHNGWKGGDGQPGSGITAEEQARLNKERAQLDRNRSHAAADGYMSDKERRRIEKRNNQINNQERRDRRD